MTESYVHPWHFIDPRHKFSRPCLHITASLTFNTLPQNHGPYLLVLVLLHSEHTRKLATDRTGESEGGVHIGEETVWVVLDLLDLETFAGVLAVLDQTGGEGTCGCV